MEPRFRHRLLGGGLGRFDLGRNDRLRLHRLRRVHIEIQALLQLHVQPALIHGDEGLGRCVAGIGHGQRKGRIAAGRGGQRRTLAGDGVAVQRDRAGKSPCVGLHGQLLHLRHVGIPRHGAGEDQQQRHDQRQHRQDALPHDAPLQGRYIRIFRLFNASPFHHRSGAVPSSIRFAAPDGAADMSPRPAAPAAPAWYSPPAALSLPTPACPALRSARA